MDFVCKSQKEREREGMSGDGNGGSGFWLSSSEIPMWSALYYPSLYKLKE